MVSFLRLVERLNVIGEGLEAGFEGLRGLGGNGAGFFVFLGGGDLLVEDGGLWVSGGELLIEAGGFWSGDGGIFAEDGRLRVGEGTFWKVGGLERVFWGVEGVEHCGRRMRFKSMYQNLKNEF